MTENPTYEELEKKVKELEQEKITLLHTETALKKQVAKLTLPLEDDENVAFENLFNLEAIQRLQDDFSRATGVASIITHTDGTPITAPSNFCCLCTDIIRKTDKGLVNCFQSDATIGRLHLEGPIIQKCMSGGLWDAGAGIAVGGRHIANWLVGQVRDNTQAEDKVLDYAREIGASENEMLEAFHKVPTMSREQFEQIANLLFTIATQLSTTAFQNLEQKRFIADRKKAEEERKKLESQIHQAVKLEALGVLAGGIAHDFNNILSAILGYSQMAIEELSPSSSAYEDIQQVMASGNRAADLVKQILLFSRHEAEDFHPVRIQETIEEVVGMFRTSLPSSINFTESIDWDCNSIHADPTQIHQIIMNLCTNARQAIKNDYGSISIDLSEISPSPSFFSHHGVEQTSQKYACVEIRDSGCGIPMEIQSKIFDPFFTTKTEEKGTGLGLAVVDGIVRKHNGLVTLSSDSKTGTVFQIYLPIVELKNATVATSENLVSNGYERILLVDDELMLNDIHKRSLEKLGYHVTCFADSLKAYKDFQKNSKSYDIVVTDMTMPNLTGLDLIKKILQINSDTKSILCTGYSKTVTENEARSFGVNAYLPKPFRPLLLAKTIRRVFDHA